MHPHCLGYRIARYLQSLSCSVALFAGHGARFDRLRGIPAGQARASEGEYRIDGKKMYGKKINSWIYFFAVHLFAIENRVSSARFLSWTAGNKSLY
jgi:hypothetical protein